MRGRRSDLNDEECLGMVDDMSTLMKTSCLIYGVLKP